MLRRILHFFWDSLRRYFIAGLLALVPMLVTIWAVAWIIARLDNLLLPHVLRLLFPGLEEAPRVPVIGAIFTVLVIILVGVGVRHLFGGELLRAWERVLRRVPVARNIYGAVKQLMEAIFSPAARESFRRVVMIEYPRRGAWVLAFTTGPARGALQDRIQERLINCFVPTTPNPTSGFYLLIPEQDVLEVDLTVEQAFKLVMSAGLVTPEMVEGGRIRPAPPAAPLAEPEPTPR